MMKFLVSSTKLARPCFNGVKSSTSNIFPNFSNIPAVCFPSFPSLPNNHSWKLPLDALILKANPAIAPPIGPIGVAIAPNRPILPMSPAVIAPPKVPIPAIPASLAPETSSSPVLPFFLKRPLNIGTNPLCHDPSLPKINSWKKSDLATIAAPAPNNAPAIGPPTIVPKIPPPENALLIAPKAAPPMINFLFLPKKSWVCFEIKPPVRSFVFSSILPNK